MAVDPAGGGPEGDFTAMEVIDMATGLQCAELEEHLPPLETAATAADLAREYNSATAGGGTQQPRLRRSGSPAGYSPV